MKSCHPNYGIQYEAMKGDVGDARYS